MYINIHEDANKTSDLVFLYLNSDLFSIVMKYNVTQRDFSKH